METLTLRQHPSFIRESTGRNGEYPVNRKIFANILTDFSQLKMNGELFIFDIKDFQNDLIRNDSKLVIDFIENSSEISLLHPHIYLILFEVIKLFFEQSKITKKCYCFLYKKIIEKNKDTISRRYDINMIKKKFL